MKEKSNTSKILEGRCQGYGPDYIPFIKANEFPSIGTASIITDPFEGRQVHTLSTAETMFYWSIRMDPNIVHIREQFLLDIDTIVMIRGKMGLKKLDIYCTTDFLIDYADGEQHAYSIKYSAKDFDRTSRKYRGREHALDSMINRQKIEYIYWKLQGVPFSIVTTEDMDRFKAANARSVMACYQPWRCKTKEQKFRFLIAHRFVTIPMEGKYINFQKAADEASFDVEDTFAKSLEALTKAERLKGGQG